MGSWASQRQGDISVDCDGPELGVQRKEGGARHSSRSILVSGRGGWWTRGAGGGFGLGLGQWRSSWQPRAGEESALLGQVSPLPLPELASISFCKKEVKGSKDQRGEGTELPAERRMKAGQEAQVTSSQGELRLGRLGGQGLVPGGKSISGEQDGR